MQRSCGSRDSENFLAVKGGLHAQKAESDGNIDHDGAGGAGRGQRVYIIIKNLGQKFSQI